MTIVKREKKNLTTTERAIKIVTYLQYTFGAIGLGLLIFIILA